MKIKAPSKRNLRRAKQKAAGDHWWLIPEKPKKSSRLKQLNKLNRRSKIKSEFIKMVEELGESPSP